MGWEADRAAYNLRQLRLAARSVDDYRASRRSLVDLGVLVQTLDALEAALESPDAGWAARFHDDILGLEMVYATRLDRGGELDDHDAQITGEAIANLSVLVGDGIAANEAIEREADD